MTLRKLKYRPAAHAIERLREYFGVKEIHALDFSNESMVKAQFVTNQTDGRRLYKNDDLDVMIVVAEDNTIITYLPAPDKRREIKRTGKPLNPAVKTQETLVSIGNNPVIAAAHATIQRELAKARRSFTREYRRLTEEIAVIGLEIARHSLNKARARSPITQQQITEKVSEIHAEQTQLAEQRKQLETEYRAIKTEAQQFIGMEVSV
ncbi:hypothetical protein [Sporosarcina psychrophila]|uniref:Transposase n=1 Tax=Sporosarcina psychrophila TaxID=1476 RepID=A0ABV2KBM8_SPOPS